MAYDPELEEDDFEEFEDGPAPVDTVAGPQTTRDQVMQRISSVRNPSADSTGENLSGDDPERDAAMQFAKSTALTSGMGRALNTLASGTGFKADNSAYDAMDKQPNIAMKELDRSALVRKAIEDRKSKSAAFAAASEKEANRFGETKRHNQAMEGIARTGQQTKAENKDDALQTNYGMARTPDDAKKLKDAAELKESFDRKIGEMITLREKHKGGAMLNREDVQRGQQLSKDLLLAYKDMAKLGVLSKSDEGILNKIIPADPLEYNLSGLLGQDPTMHRMKSFQADTNKDFDSRISNRVRGGAMANRGGAQDSDSPGGGEGLINETKAGGGRVTVSNGKETVSIEITDLPDAIADGYQVVKK